MLGMGWRSSEEQKFVFKDQQINYQTVIWKMVQRLYIQICNILDPIRPGI